MEGKILAWLEELFGSEEWTDCFCVEVKHHVSNGKILVYVDADEGINLDRCKKISRFLEAYLDEEAGIKEDYNLEVSSPGIDRPLYDNIRQYRKNIGREIEAHLEDGEKKKGMMTDVSSEGITLTYKENKKNMESFFPFSEITKAFVQIKFK